MSKTWPPTARRPGTTGSQLRSGVKARAEEWSSGRGGRRGAAAGALRQDEDQGRYRDGKDQGGEGTAELQPAVGSGEVGESFPAMIDSTIAPQENHQLNDRARICRKSISASTLINQWFAVTAWIFAPWSKAVLPSL